MSLILDALRKMEQERRSRRGSVQDLRPEVLRYRGASEPKEPARFPVAVVAGLLLLCAGVGAGFLLKGRGAQPAPEPVAAAVPAVPPVAAAVPTTPPVAPAPPVAPVAAPVTLAPPPAPVAAPVPVQPAAAEPQAATLPVAQPRKRARMAAASPAPAPEAPPQKVVQEPVASAAPQDISISGIAYQDERRLRRAVVNGILIGEGGDVAGAHVIEIKETKVRMSRGGRVFEVPFSSGQSR